MNNQSLQFANNGVFIETFVSGREVCAEDRGATTRVAIESDHGQTETQWKSGSTRGRFDSDWMMFFFEQPRNPVQWTAVQIRDETWNATLIWQLAMMKAITKLMEITGDCEVMGITEREEVKSRSD
jgi:hypothetical protein